MTYHFCSSHFCEVAICTGLYWMILIWPCSLMYQWLPAFGGSASEDRLAVSWSDSWWLWLILGLLGPKSTVQEASICQVPSCFKFAIVLLAKTSHWVKPRVNVEKDYSKKKIQSNMNIFYSCYWTVIGLGD